MTKKWKKWKKWGQTPFFPSFFAALLFALPAGSPVAADLPSFAQVRADWRSSDAWLLDRQGRVLQRVRVDMKTRRHEWTSEARVSQALKEALLASEDQRFLEHGGVDWKAVLNAAVANAGGKPVRGASTLTMQLAGMLDPELRRGDAPGAPPRSVAQKLKQAGAALRLERQWSKAQILEAYLNLVTFRGELQGVSAMSHGLFGKAPHGLTRRESAIAAALIRGPNAEAARVADRACWLLNHRETSGGSKPARADACDGLVTEVRQVLARGYEAFPREDLAPHAARRVFARTPPVPGARIASTLDAAIQDVARRALRTRLTELSGRNVEDGAVLVLDNASGDVLAYVGSSGELSRAAQVDGVAASRQAGSTLKPFLFALAIDQGYLDAASVLEDAPVQIRTDAGLYAPRDYAGSYRGPVSVRAALAGSLNVPAVRALNLVGTDRFVTVLRELGLDTVAEAGDHYGLSLALGSADVNLWSLTNAYRVLATGGQLAAPRLIATGDTGPRRRVFGAAASHIVADILADRAARSVAFGMANPLETPFWTAVKTGTSKDMRDNWAVGFSSRYTVGVWVGNAGGAPMHDVSGVSGAAPVWRDVMMFLHRHLASEPPTTPSGVVARELRFEPAIEPARRELFVAGRERDRVRLTGRPAHPAIIAPAAGTIVALDPDIPRANQRLTLAADAPRGARLELDDRVLGGAGRPYAWLPWPGAHVLRLRAADGSVLDEAAFEVRGARVARAATPTPSARRP